MIIAEQEFAVPNRHGDQLYTTLTLPRDIHGPVPLVILLHGFRGSRNYSFLPWVAQHGAASGAAMLRVCFSLNGMKNTSWLVQSTADFANNTISRECDDVADVISAVESHECFSTLRTLWDGTISFIGHSRGGGIALVAAKELMEKNPAILRRVAVWNSVGLWNRWTPRQAAAWKEAGVFEMQNQRTMQMLTMNATYVEDIENAADRIDLTAACSLLGDRLRCIHAEHDLTVPLKEIEQLAAQANNSSAIHVISNTSHTFSMDHPVSRITRGLTNALEATFPWVLA